VEPTPPPYDFKDFAAYLSRPTDALARRESGESGSKKIEAFGSSRSGSSLRDAYEMYLLTAASRRVSVAEACTRLLGRGGDCILASLGKPVRELLRLETIFRAVAQVVQWDCEAAGRADVNAVERTIGGQLTVRLAIYTPTTLIPVPKAMLPRLGLSEEEALAQAAANAASDPGPHWRLGEGGAVGLPLSPGSAGAWLLEPEMFQPHADDRPIVVFADHDVLLRADRRDAPGLATLAGMAESGLLIDGRAGVPLAWERSGWSEWDGGDAGDVKARFEFLSGLSRFRDYRMQTDALHRVLRARGLNAFVATPLIGRTGSAGPLNVAAAWSDLPYGSILPKCDEVGFVRGREQPSSYSVFGTAPWSRVVEVMGPRMTKVAAWPERYHVHGFPDVAQLARLELVGPAGEPATPPRSKDSEDVETCCERV
jgi:hypothetical protein